VTRFPRFKRSPEIQPLRFTNRDCEILKCLQRHRFLRSDHIVALCAGSRQQVLRRLQRLFHHGYLERPRCQIDYYQSGSRRIAYGLGNKGAAWLKRELSLQFHKLDWEQKGRVGRLFLEHALLVSDIMVALELACRNRKDIRLLSADDLRIPNMREPFQWKVDIGQRQKCGVIPDRVFGLEANGNQCWYFLEADRDTMPITRSDLVSATAAQLVTIGTMDTILVHPREVFRCAIIAAAAAIALIHNHPSGEPQPSDADIKVTRDLIRAGQLLKIEVIDHVIIGRPNHCSMRELGFFAI
jgi:proteasome lid subunit RPN8/RPN11/DNA-binding Lrp family transcriptional regulator